MASSPPERPRMTRHWEKQRETFLKAIERMKADPQIMEAYRATFESFWFLCTSSTDQTEECIKRYRSDYDAWFQELNSRVPALIHMFGSKLELWLWVWFHNQAGAPVPEWLPPIPELEHLGPDNPLAMGPDGDVQHSNRASGQHLLQLRDYHRSFRPAQKAGRPPKEVGLAIRAYQLHLDGKHWTDIAQELFGPLPYGQERERLRGHIRRLLERGAIEHQRP